MKTLLLFPIAFTVLCSAAEVPTWLGDAECGATEIAAVSGADVFPTPNAPRPNEGVGLDSASRLSLLDGDTETATRALLEAMPDHESLLSAYGAVIACVSEAQGELDIEAMRAACPSFHRSHARFQEDRSVAILQWIAQKFWEMPDGEEKEALYCRFLGDLDCLVYGGTVSPDQALTIACSAVYAYKEIEPCSSISPCLIDFVAKQARSAAVREPARIKDIVIEVRDVTWDEQQRSQLSEILQAEFPGTPSDASHRNQGSLSAPIGRQDYMSLLTLSFEEIYERTAREDRASSYTRDVNYYGRYAVRALLERYNESPDEVTGIITRMIQEGVKVNTISFFVYSKPEISADLRRAIVEGVAGRLTLDSASDEFYGLCRRMGRSLEVFSEDPQMLDLQRRIGEILIEAVITSEKRQTLGRNMASWRNVAYESLIEGTKGSGALLKAKLADFAAEKLASKTGFQDATPECQDAITTKLRSLKVYWSESDDDS